MSQYIFTITIKVRDYTRHEFCESRGFTFRAMQEQGIDPVVSKIEIEYHTPLRLGETMTSSLWIERRGPRFIFHQDIFAPSGALAVSALVTIVALENGRISRGDSIAPLMIND